MNTVSEITEALDALHTEEKRKVLPRFFKSGPGEYGEGDLFLGTVVPDIRKVAKEYSSISLEEIGSLLESPFHEVRMCGLLILVAKCRKTVPEEFLDFYLSHTSRINNWDLVDLSAPSVAGEYLLVHPEKRQILYSLAGSSWLWDQRIAVVSTLTLIRHNDFKDIYALAVKLMNHPHDLMHKAVGWMLREAGKRDQPRLEVFLDRYAPEMPRTMLRYAIEKFPEPLRKHYLSL